MALKQIKNTYELQKDIEGVFRSHPDVNKVLYGVWRMGDEENIPYPLVAITKNNLSTVNDSLLALNINILYADRLTDSRDNMEYIQSVGESVILECLNRIKNCGYKIAQTGNISIQPFTEQFADNCAGSAVTGLTLQIPSFIGQCEWLEVDDCDRCNM